VIFVGEKKTKWAFQEIKHTTLLWKKKTPIITCPPNTLEKLNSCGCFTVLNLVGEFASIKLAEEHMGCLLL